MKTIEELLQNLARADVTEFAVVSDCLPCVKVGAAFKPVDKHATKTDEILEMLVATGGSRYVDALGAAPSQWSVKIDKLGTVGVRAVLRNNVVQARFVLTKKDPNAVPPPAPVRKPPPPPKPRQAEIDLEDDDGPTIQVKSPPGSDKDRPDEKDSAAFLAAMPADPLMDLEADLDFSNPIPPPSAATPGPGRASPAVPDLERPGRPAHRSGAHELDLDLGFDSEAAASSPKAPLFTSGAAAPAMAKGAPAPAPIIDLDLAPMVAEALAPPVEGAWPPPYALAKQAPPGTIENLLAQARSLRASDLHVVPERPLLLRIAGDLVPRGQPIDEAFAAKIVDAIVPARLRPQLDAEGSCDFALVDAHGRCRVNVSRQRTGHKICLRLVPAQIPTLEALGLPPEIAHATHHHQGLILVTGPTGHGKTTTLAAIVNLINTNTTHHVITVEDPIEFVHPRKRAMMSQREVGTSTKTFQSALKGSLREDPDVIVVGELRDTETVRMALSASETGHLVIGTMNTPSAAKTIDRLIDLFPPADQAQVRMTLAGGLRLIVSQRLIPNVDRTRFVVCAELLPGSVSLWSLIRDDKTFQIPSLQQRGKGIGIIRIDDTLCDLVKAGKTTLEIAKEWAEDPKELELNVLGKRPQIALPNQPGAPAKPGAPGATMQGFLGKAGNLFRKGE